MFETEQTLQVRPGDILLRSVYGADGSERSKKYQLVAAIRPAEEDINGEVVLLDPTSTHAISLERIHDHRKSTSTEASIWGEILFPGGSRITRKHADLAEVPAEITWPNYP